MGALTSDAGDELKGLAPSHGARRVGRYLLCDQIGSGGMATIHLARLLGPQGFSRTVAIKQLHPQFAQNPQFVAMLLDEARLAVRVRHVNVVSPLDIVTTESELFIVMDYVNGESFANLLVATDGPLKPAFAAAIMVQVLLGLHAAHEATREQGDALGLVHRDVSPQNILVGQDGVTRVVDFGIAKAVARTQTTDGGMVKGKLGYMAPEQIRLLPVDRRTDLFSAGVVLWEALTGTGLFVSDTLGGSIEAILHAEIAPPSRLNPAVTPELDAVVLKALTRDRDERFQDAKSMAAALERATPLASALEIIDWVASLAGTELERRAELVKRVEAMAWEPARDAAPPAPAANDAASSPRAGGWSGSVEVAPVLQRRTPTLLGIARPRRDEGASSSADALSGGLAGDAAAGFAARSALGASGRITSVAPLATGESTGIAVGGDRYASASSDGKSGRGWRSKGVALAIALGGIATAVAVLALSSGERAGSFAVAQEVSIDDPALTIEAVSAPLQSADPPATGAVAPGRGAGSAIEPSAGLPVRPVRNDVASQRTGQETPPSLEPGDDEREEARDAEGGTSEKLDSRARSRSSRSARSERSSSSSRTAAASSRRAGAPRKPPRDADSAAAPEQRAKPAPRAGNCDPPWVVNEQQVKVFKAECLR